MAAQVTAMAMATTTMATMTMVMSSLSSSLLLLFLGQIIFLSSVSVSVEAVEACTSIPRIQARFLCNRNLIRSDFNATEAIEEYVRAQIDNDSGENLQPYRLLFYTSVSLSAFEDIDPREWYYAQCDPSSVETLVTIDARGYYHWDEGPSDSVAKNRDDNSTEMQHPHHVEKQNYLIRQDLIALYLKKYFKSQVCESYIHHFEYKVETWDETRYPIPIGSSGSAAFSKMTPIFDDDEDQIFFNHTQSDNDNERSCPALFLQPPLVKGGGQIDYPSSSIHPLLTHDGEYENPQEHHTKQFYHDLMLHRQATDGYHFDHDHYLLCGGAHGAFDDYEDPSPLFIVIGILAGYVMVYMVKAEYARPLRYPELPRRTTRRGTYFGPRDESDDDNDDENRQLTAQQNEREIELATF